MFPITLDTSLLPIAVIGNGVATHRRLQLFQAAGAKHLTHFKEMPEEAALSGFKIAFVADFDEATSLQIYQKLKPLLNWCLSARANCTIPRSTNFGDRIPDAKR